MELCTLSPCLHPLFLALTMELIWRAAGFPQLLDVSLVALKQSAALSMYETASFFLQAFAPGRNNLNDSKLLGTRVART